MKVLGYWLVCWLLTCPLLAAQDVSLESRLAELQAAYSAEPQWKDGLFAPEFLQTVPAPRMRSILAELFAQTGRIERFETVESKNARSGRYRAITADGFQVPISITLEERPPHAIVGLFFQTPEPLIPSLEALSERIAKLPGMSSFGLWKLGDKPERLAGHEPDRALAIGSAFKLYILGALLADVQAGKRQFADSIPLREAWRSLPSGRMQDWPVGLPVTLGSLAAGMISESDNTATDHLLFTLGRERVEAQLALMGNAQPERSFPFLSTGEMFRLKLGSKGEAAKGYAKLDLAGRRSYLAKELGPERVPLSELSASAGSWSRPREIESVEWFASASDLMRALDWLRRQSAGEPLTRGILSINRGLGISEEEFPYVGFKGGSEPGVLCFAYLAQAKNGEWFALCVAWNDPKRSVSNEKLAGLVVRGFGLLGESPAKTESR